MICDMSAAEEVEPVARIPEAFRRIDDFQTEDQARCNTNFTKSQLQTLLSKFDMPEINVVYGANLLEFGKTLPEKLFGFISQKIYKRLTFYLFLRVAQQIQPRSIDVKNPAIVIQRLITYWRILE